MKPDSGKPNDREQELRDRANQLKRDATDKAKNFGNKAKSAFDKTRDDVSEKKRQFDQDRADAKNKRDRG
jgi:hypothetical protein